jgi:serine/threonine-protein kinase
MAPEQALCRPISAATDLYSVGIMLYEMLSGSVPYLADSAVATAMKHVQEPIPVLPPLGLPVEVEDAWRALITRLLAKDPGERPSTAASVAAALEHLELRSREALGLSSATEEEISSLLRAPELAEDLAATALFVPSDPVTAPATARPRRGAALAAAAGVAIVGALVVAVAVGFPGSDKSSATPERQSAATPLPGPTETSRGELLSAAGPADAPAAPAPALVAAVDPGRHVEQRPVSSVVEPTDASPAAAAPPPEDVNHAAPAEAPQASPARLVVDSAPPGASVSLNERVVCTTPCDEQLAPEGKALLAFAREGYERAELAVDLAPGSTVARSVELRRAARPAVRKVERRKPKEPPATVEAVTVPAAPSNRQLPAFRAEPGPSLPKLRVD